jgi:hypothetical protein
MRSFFFFFNLDISSLLLVLISVELLATPGDHIDQGSDKIVIMQLDKPLNFAAEQQPTSLTVKLVACIFYL